MNFQVRKQVVVVITVLMSTMFACNLIQRENQKTTQQGFYAIQPETILGVLTHNEDKVFTPITEQDVNYSVTNPSVNWAQSDYFQIVDAFYRLVLYDTLDDWELSSMSFVLGCADVDFGLQDGRFSFFKIVKNEHNEEVLVSRSIDVDPRYKIVLLWEREFYPYVITRSSIDLADIKFNSAEALQIAEDNGGQNLRLSLNNECSIGLSLSPDSAEYRGWYVYYTRRDNRRLIFDLSIDPFTGDIR